MLFPEFSISPSGSYPLNLFKFRNPVLENNFDRIPSSQCLRVEWTQNYNFNISSKNSRLSCRLFSGVKNLEVIPFSQFQISNIMSGLFFCLPLVLALELLNLSAWVPTEHSFQQMFIRYVFSVRFFRYVFERNKHCFRKRLWKEDERTEGGSKYSVMRHMTTKNLSWTDLKANVLILWLNL